MRQFNPTSLAFNAKRAREAMLAQIAIPEDIVNAALRRTRALVDAKKTRFFTHQGEIINKVDVEDHEAQLRATDQIYSIAGLYVRDRDVQPPPVSYAVEVDPRSGVVRMVLRVADGGDADDVIEHTTRAVVDGASTQNEAMPEANAAAVVALPMSAVQSAPDLPVRAAEPLPKIIRVKRGRLPKEVYDALFSEDDDSG